MVAAANILVEATKNSFVVPNFVAVTKLFFFSVKKEIERSDEQVIGQKRQRLNNVLSRRNMAADSTGQIFSFGPERPT